MIPLSLAIITLALEVFLLRLTMRRNERRNREQLIAMRRELKLVKRQVRSAGVYR